MPWGKHDDKFHRNRKVKPLRHTAQGLAALGLRSILHSECLDDPELDGRIDAADLRSKHERTLCEVLVTAGLLERDGDGYLIHDWADYNPTQEGLKRARDKTKQRVNKHRNGDVTPLHEPLQTPLHDESDTVTPTLPHAGAPARVGARALPVPVPVPVPVPIPNSGSSSGSSEICSEPLNAPEPLAQVAPPSVRRPPPRTEENRAAWDGYAEAYEARYGEPPTRNAKANGQIAQFVNRVPSGEAPAIAAFFVTLNKRWYVDRGHHLDCLLADAETLRTQWATGRRTTSHEAREADRREGRGQEYEDLGRKLDAEVAS